MDYLIGLGDEVVAVGDADQSELRASSADVPKDRLGCRCIQRRERLIKDESRCIDEQGAGYGYALGLTFAARVIESAFIIEDEVGIGKMQGFAHGGFRSRGIAEEKIVSDRAGEERVALRNISKPYGRSDNRALFDRQQSKQELDKSGLTDACFSYYSGKRSGRDRSVDMRQYRLIGVRIGEGEIVDGYC